jgi:hypothetical protein
MNIRCMTTNIYYRKNSYIIFKIAYFYSFYGCGFIINAIQNEEYDGHIYIRLRKSTSLFRGFQVLFTQVVQVPE